MMLLHKTIVQLRVPVPFSFHSVLFATVMGVCVCVWVPILRARHFFCLSYGCKVKILRWRWNEMKKTRNEFLCMQKFPVECLKISILIEKLLHHITHLIVRLSHTHHCNSCWKCAAALCFFLSPVLVLILLWSKIESHSGNETSEKKNTVGDYSQWKAKKECSAQSFCFH